MRRAMLTVAGASLAAVVAAQQPPAPSTVQQQFNAAEALDAGKDPAAALAAWEALEQRTQKNRRSHAIMLVRKSAALARLGRLQDAVVAARAGLADLPAGDATLAADRTRAYLTIGRGAELALDYAGAAQSFRQAEDNATTPSDKVGAIFGQIATLTFTDSDAAMAASARADTILAANKSAPEVQASFAAAKGILLMNRADFAGARKLTTEAVRLRGGLTSKTDLEDVSVRSDAALALLLAVAWGVDLTAYATGYATAAWPAAMVSVRGFALAGAAVLFAFGLRRGEHTFAPSHRVAVNAVALAAVAAYLAATMVATDLADRWVGQHARTAQTAIVLGAATALITLVSTPWPRAWLRVMVAKHLFRHRYDYRVEWQRVTSALGHVEGTAAAPLGCRAIQAIADLTCSPAGLLLVPDGEALGVAATWRWEGEEGAPPPLARYLAASGRIIALNAVRDRSAPTAEIEAVPSWMVGRADAWAIVPLFHGAALVGAILLARPPVERALDWEDFDLLRVAGRQAASCLAEDRARSALADAERFDEFNRRFAFILHDIKNLVSGLTLVARNAERHADNPDFRADMVATLQDSATRMNVLLARLSQHHQHAAEPTVAVDVGALAARIAGERRAQHRIEVAGEGLALARPRALEQILGHLIQNAVEASRTDQPVLVSVQTAPGGVTIEVADRGCGMSGAFLRDQLFRPFASSKPGGFGLGAHEARELARGMGGTIEVESREGEGTRFSVRLPAAPAMEEAA